MRYLKRFESKVNLYELVEECFIEFLDDETAYFWKDDGFVGGEFSISKWSGDNKIEDIDSAIQISKKQVEFLSDIKVAVNRLSDMTPVLIKWNMDSDLSSFVIKIYQSENLKVGEFWTMVETEGKKQKILLNRNKIMEILKLEKGVELSIWSSGVDETLKILFKNRDQFDLHMYRDFLNRREELPNGFFENEVVEDALIINPELMERWRKLGKNFEKLKIDSDPLVSKIEYISRGQDRKYYGSGGSYTKEEWSISLKLNKKYKFSF
jgi:hypothetical protein